MWCSQLCRGLGERIQKLQGETECGGPKRKPQELAAHSNYHRLFKIKKKWKEGSLRMSSGVPSPVPMWPAGPGALAQAGDVGTATRGRHDALGGAAGNVVVNLST